MYFPNLGKRLRGVDPTNLLDEDWMEKEVLVCCPPVPLCCVIRSYHLPVTSTCKKHNVTTTEPSSK